jgi:hypothetical protein
MIQDVHPGSRIRILIFLPIPDPGPRGQKSTGSESLIQTVKFGSLYWTDTYTACGGKRVQNFL